jgi:hypothetical protein
MKYSTRLPFPDETFQTIDGKPLPFTENDVVLVRQDGQTRPCNKQTFAETFVPDGTFGENGTPNFIKK